MSFAVILFCDAGCDNQTVLFRNCILVKLPLLSGCPVPTDVSKRLFRLVVVTKQYFLGHFCFLV